MNIAKLLSSLFGSRNSRILKRMSLVVDKINALEEKLIRLTDAEISKSTLELKERAKTTALGKLLPEAFALVREASKRTLGLRHFDVQMLGGIALHRGRIAEMGTGEGKTLVATLPAYLNALLGKVHIVTVNDYLAKRDANWMRPVYEMLGLSVGVVVPGLSLDEKKVAYACDVVYATNNELGFDYLRDKMAYNKEHCVQGDLEFAIVDEVDSIFIDEARTPLIISGAAETSSDMYQVMNTIIKHLQPQKEQDGLGDYFIDEKAKQIYLTEAGHEKIEEFCIKNNLLKNNESLYHASNSMLVHHVNSAIRAHVLYHKDVDYIVKDGKVVIIDEHTGRTMLGRRWSDGLHQAVEAKEGVSIQNENQTLASITFQNFFRLYNKLSGMTGTADTEAYELHQIYNMEVVVIPTNKPIKRQDLSDLVYLTHKEKLAAIIKDIKENVEKGRPVLVGTVSIEKSEELSGILEQKKIKHSVLNAKNHAKEAEIIAQAGMPGAVTIATNMAGRGTDIVLGGNPQVQIKEREEAAELSAKQKEQLLEQWQERQKKVIAAGGLHVIGTERHESRRIDNQLRGRAGRQGDPGSTQFYLSFSDPLMRIFASERTANLMRRLGAEDGEAITHPWVNRTIENAQRKVEDRNFDIRKQLLEYDNVANEQRKIMYKQRDEVLYSEDVTDSILGFWDEVMEGLFDEYIPPYSLEGSWNAEGLEHILQSEFGVNLPVTEWLKDEEANEELMAKRLVQETLALYQTKKGIVSEKVIQEFEKTVMLHAMDTHWREHLAMMESLRQGINLRGYAQKDPKQEYKREAFELFTSMLDAIRREVVAILLRTEVREQQDVAAVDEQRRREASNLSYQHDQLDDELSVSGAPTSKPTEAGVRHHKVGRNESCPCGSGKKFKHCHGVVR